MWAQFENNHSRAQSNTFSVEKITGGVMSAAERWVMHCFSSERTSNTDCIMIISDVYTWLHGWMVEVGTKGATEEALILLITVQNGHDRDNFYCSFTNCSWFFHNNRKRIIWRWPNLSRRRVCVGTVKEQTCHSLFV